MIIFFLFPLPGDFCKVESQFHLNFTMGLTSSQMDNIVSAESTKTTISNNVENDSILGQNLLTFLNEMRSLPQESKDCQQFVEKWINSSILDPSLWSSNKNTLSMSNEDYSLLPELAKRINHLLDYVNFNDARNNHALFVSIMEYIKQHLEPRGWMIFSKSSKSCLNPEYVNFYLTWMHNGVIVKGFWSMTVPIRDVEKFGLKI